eukprot:gene26060-31467_t
MGSLLALVCAILCFNVVKGHLSFGKKRVHSVLHEELRPLLRRTNRPDPDTPYTVYFAMRLLNIDDLEKFLLQVSDPNSPEFGKHLTREEVGRRVRNDAAVEALLAFLSHEQERIGYQLSIERSLYDEYIWATAPVRVWEEVFETSLYNYEHRNNGPSRPNRRAVTQVGSEQYSLPPELSDLVMAVFPLCHMSPPRTVDLHLTPLVSPNAATASSFLRTQAAPRDGNVRPALLNEYYDIPSANLSPQKIGNTTLASLAIYATIGQTLSPTDLTRFQSTFNLPAQNLKGSRGGYVDDFPCYPRGSSPANLNDCAEANLDVQYAMAIARKLDMYWDYSDASFAAWASTVSSLDPIPQVFSLSYGQDEIATSAAEKTAFQQQAIMLGTMGVTLVVASGDDGAPGWRVSQGWPCGYFPSFPATSPYVVAVGGTMGPEDGTDFDEVTASTRPGWSGVFTSGGGFSAFYSAPSWQSTLVSSYLNNPPSPITLGYNAAGRGLPDISLLSMNYVVVLGGGLYLLSGTSASAPVFAGMLARINQERMEKGLGTIGLPTPYLYQQARYVDVPSPFFLRDITVGDNRCITTRMCCSQGFSAGTGWDPATGLGSLNFSALRDLLVDESITRFPTMTPTPDNTRPSLQPTILPTRRPTRTPTVRPTRFPSQLPSPAPTISPTVLPTVVPSSPPSPSPNPTFSPSQAPTIRPTTLPTLEPSLSPTTLTPTAVPTQTSVAPSTSLPTYTPTDVPTSDPSLSPTPEPTYTPSENPTMYQSVLLSAYPSSVVSSNDPTHMPSYTPTQNPSIPPTQVPSLLPTPMPTVVPTIVPTSAPTLVPSQVPSQVPTMIPTLAPTRIPTRRPSISPTISPSHAPTLAPTTDFPVVSSAPTVAYLVSVGALLTFNNAQVDTLAESDLLDLSNVVTEGVCEGVGVSGDFCACGGGQGCFLVEGAATVWALVNISLPLSALAGASTSPASLAGVNSWHAASFPGTPQEGVLLLQQQVLALDATPVLAQLTAQKPEAFATSSVGAVAAVGGTFTPIESSPTHFPTSGGGNNNEGLRSSTFRLIIIAGSVLVGVGSLLTTVWCWIRRKSGNVDSGRPKSDNGGVGFVSDHVIVEEGGGETRL